MTYKTYIRVFYINFARGLEKAEAREFFGTQQALNDIPGNHESSNHLIYIINNNGNNTG